MTTGTDEWPPELPEWLTSAEMCDLFNVQTQTPGKWAKNGRIKFSRTPGGRLRFHRDDVYPFLLESRRQT